MQALWSWLNTPPATGAVLDLFGLLCLLVFAPGFLASAWFSRGESHLRPTMAAHAEGIQHWAHVGIWLFGPGLFFFAMRALQLNPLSFGEPIWLVGNLLAVAVATFRFVSRKKNTPLP